LPNTKTAEGAHDNHDDDLEYPPKDQSAGGEPTERKPLEPYRPIFHSNSKQFEYGEDRRYRQIVFHFQETPEQDVIGKLKSHGYKWRSEVPAETKITGLNIASRPPGGARASSVKHE
jgi:hypothetical protein